jgi:hypothetical protein
MREIIKLVEDDSLKATPAGCEVKLRLKWYRSLPVSCIERLQVSLDGVQVDPAQVRFGVNGHQFKLEELADLVEEFWFIQDSAVLSIVDPGKVKTGEAHKVRVEMAVRFPYIPIGPGKFLTHIHDYSTEQVAH